MSLAEKRVGMGKKKEDEGVKKGGIKRRRG